MDDPDHDASAIMTGGTVARMSSAERAADRSPLVQRSRSRSLQQATAIIDAARRLISVKGDKFTTQELIKEAGVALQTFYRHFAGKDQLLLSVIEDMVTEACKAYENEARDLPDPIARLRYYMTRALGSLDIDGTVAAGPRFITAQTWRLHQLYPDELAEATRPFADLVLREIQAAAEAGLVKPANLEYAAWLVTQLVRTVYHHNAFATTKQPAEMIADDLWTFCLAALGGSPAAEPPRGAGKPGGRATRSRALHEGEMRVKSAPGSAAATAPSKRRSGTSGRRAPRR